MQQKTEELTKVKKSIWKNGKIYIVNIELPKDLPKIWKEFCTGRVL